MYMLFCLQCNPHAIPHAVIEGAWRRRPYWPCMTLHTEPPPSLPEVALLSWNCCMISIWFQWNINKQHTLALLWDVRCGDIDLGMQMTQTDNQLSSRSCPERTACRRPLTLFYRLNPPHSDKPQQLRDQNGFQPSKLASWHCCIKTLMDLRKRKKKSLHYGVVMA